MTINNEDIIYRDPTDPEGLRGLTKYQQTIIASTFYQQDIDPNSREVSETKILTFLTDILESKLLEDYRPTIVSQETWTLFPERARIKHYYFLCDGTSSVIDLFAWKLDSPLNYKDPTMEKYTPSVRSNPFDENYYYSDTTPIVLWMSVRAIFVGNESKRKGETRNAFINRIYRQRKRNEGLSRKETLSKMYAISVSSLQKKGYLKSGTRFATEEGHIRGLEQAEYLGEKAFDDYFKDFEEIVKLSRGANK